MVCLYKCSATQSTLQPCVLLVVVYLLFFYVVLAVVDVLLHYFSSRLQPFYYVSFRMILDMLLPN